MSTTTRRALRLTGAVLGAALVLGSAAGAASAKEAASGGTTTGGGGTTACFPVTSLTAKADPKVGETGLASIAVSYGVKPCVSGQAVLVRTTVSEYTDPAAIAYQNLNAPLDGKFTAFGIKLRTTYRVEVAVTDAISGAALGTSTVYSAAVPKGV